MKTHDTNKPIIQTLNGNLTERVPFWFMRQAGRYLPEYRKLRAEAGGFLDMAYNPDHACEITLQPIRRYQMDAAILFSDILVIPHAMGQPLSFVAGEGPKLERIKSIEDLDKIETGKAGSLDDTLSPIYQAIARIREQLIKENFDKTTLIGFAGAPWTVITYMVEGGGSKTYGATKNWAYNDPETFEILINRVTDATIHYLKKQIDAGVEAVQLFDSWSGVLDENHFKKYSIHPARRIVEELKSYAPDIPIIGFPRLAGVLAPTYARETKIDALGVDFSQSLSWINDQLPKNFPVQGNLDPIYLLKGGDPMIDAATRIFETLKDRPFIFNLGHGVIKETKPEDMAKLCDVIKTFKR